MRHPAGNAYLLYTFDKNEANGYQAIVKLSPDFRRVLSPREGGVIAEFPKPGSNCREAAAMFKRAATYYYIMSETRGWRPSNTWYRTASSVGPVAQWSALLQVAVTPAGDAYSFRTQHDFVLPFTGSSTTTYIYCGDTNWNGKADNGLRVTAGTYLLYLKAGTMAASSKAVFLK